MLQGNSTLALGDTAGTALTVAAYYRFLEIAPHLTSQDLTAKAEKAFDGVVAKIDDNGWVTHVSSTENVHGSPLILQSASTPWARTVGLSTPKITHCTHRRDKRSLPRCGKLVRMPDTNQYLTLVSSYFISTF